MTAEIPKEILSTIEGLRRAEKSNSAAITVYTLAGVKFASRIDEAQSLCTKMLAILELMPKQDMIDVSKIKKANEFLSAVIPKFMEAID